LYSRKIKNKQHFVYDDEKEFRLQSSESLIDDWRNANTKEWTKSDDGKVLQVLKRGVFTNHSGQKVEYVRTLLGTYTVRKKDRMAGDPPKNIYSFSRDKTSYDIQTSKRKATSGEVLFAQYVVRGVEPTEAYIKAFPTNKRRWAQSASQSLLRQERIVNLISKEVKNALEEVGIHHEDILAKVWSIANDDDQTSSSRVRCLELLAKISDMMPNSEKRSESLTVFQGFTPEQLASLSSGDTQMIGQMEEPIEEGGD
jgi:hypothetical protein